MATQQLCCAQRGGAIDSPRAVRKQLGVAFPGLGGREFGIARTKTGNFAIVPMGSGVYRLAAIECDQPAIDHDVPMTLDELQAAIRRVIGLDLPMHEPVWLSRPTDSSRLVERYRDGRVFLAGDAAHVH